MIRFAIGALLRSQPLPVRYLGSTIVVSRAFFSSKREIVKSFLRGWIEGVKTAKTDKEPTVKVLQQKFLKPPIDPGQDP